MKDLSIPDEVKITVHEDEVKYALDDLSTNWMSCDDSFKDRISKSNLNRYCKVKHLSKEIMIRNTFDEGVNLLNEEKYVKAISKFDEVLFYDPDYAEVLLNKSYALRGLKHYVKSLRYYKRAVKADSSVKNIIYYGEMLKLANDERRCFPKLKMNIYAGDEYFTKGEFNLAVESYNRALVNPSKFKDKILFKLLNKKATALIKLGMFEEALECYDESLNVKVNDYAIYGKGLCEFKLNLPVDSDFLKPLNVDKIHLLKQVVILNGLEYYCESNRICDYLFDNHFKMDDYYFKLIRNKIKSLKGLNMDYSNFEVMLNDLINVKSL